MHKTHKHTHTRANTQFCCLFSRERDGWDLIFVRLLLIGRDGNDSVKY